MKRLVVVTWVIAAVSIALAVMFIARSRQRTDQAVGAMPSESVMPDPAARRLAGDLRTWLQEMSATDLKTLNTTGRIAFRWDQLKSTDPVRAALIDDYVEAKRVAFAKALTIRPLPSRVAVHHYPDTVEFQRLDPGSIRVVIRSKDGIRESYVQISGR